MTEITQLINLNDKQLDLTTKTIEFDNFSEQWWSYPVDNNEQ